jgi:UDP-N-acetylmuramyl pentapeptide synthase
MGYLQNFSPRSTRLRQAVSKLLTALTPLIRLGSIAYRRSLLRKTRFAVAVGSYGKTTTARALSLALTETIHPHLQNNARAWPYLAILRTLPGSHYAVAEVGISKPGDMKPYAQAISPQIVVVTSIGSEHHSSLGTLENTRSEKARMVEALGKNGVAVLNGDDPHVLWMKTRTEARVVTFGRGADCDVRVLESQTSWPKGTQLRVLCGDEEVEVHTRLLGDLPQNAVVAALAVAWVEGLSLTETAGRLAGLAPMRSRLELVELAGGAHLIRDEVKSSYETMETALDILEQIPAQRRICVFGQISEPPGSQGPLYRELGQRIADIAAVAMFVADKSTAQRYKSGATRAGMSSEAIIHVDQDVQEATRLLEEMIEPGDVVLIKGRDNQHLHRISLALMGREVGCAVKVCRLKLVDCDFCSRLESGWGERQVVP